MSKHIFETGDKVKLVDTDQSPAQNRALGKIGTVCYSPMNGYSDVRFEGESGSIHVLNARLEHTSDLETLVARANDGIKAMQELAVKHAGKVEYDKLAVREAETPFVLDVFVDYWPAEFRIAKPRFAPFTTSNGWKVELKGDRLHVGCTDFDRSTLADMLEGVITKSYCVSGSLKACRIGVIYHTHTLPWADAERIYEELKKAGV